MEQIARLPAHARCAYAAPVQNLAHLGVSSDLNLRTTATDAKKYFDLLKAKHKELKERRLATARPQV